MPFDVLDSLRWVTQSCAIGIVLMGPGSYFANEILWAYSARATPTTNYRMEFRELIERRTPAGANGFKHVVRAAEIYESWREYLHSDEYIEAAEQNPDEEGLWRAQVGAVTVGPYPRDGLAPELASMAQLKERGLDDALDEAGRAEVFFPDITTADYAAVQDSHALHNIVLMEPLVLQLSRYCIARMRICAAAGDEAGAAEWFARTMALGLARGARPLLIDYLNGVNCLSLGLEEVRCQLADGLCSPALCSSYAATLDSAVSRRPELSWALAGERLYALDCVQYSHALNGRPIVTAFRELCDDSWQEESRILDWLSIDELGPLANVAWWCYPSRAQSIRDTDAAYDSLISDAQRSRRERRLDLDERIAAMHSANRAYWHGFKSVVWRIFLKSDELERDFAATRIMLALELYRAVHARPPQRLSELVPDYLPANPPDPFAPDGQFVFLPHKDSSAEAAFDYTLYSVGVDGIDSELGRNPSASATDCDVLLSERRFPTDPYISD